MKNHLDLTPGDRRRYSLSRAINAMVTGDWKSAGFERACDLALQKEFGEAETANTFRVPADVLMHSSEKRDLTSAGTSGSQFLVGTDNAPSGSFIELLRNKTVLDKAGATFLTGLRGNVTIPRQSAAATAYWLANEATAITESQMTLGQLTLSPKTVGAYTEISRMMLLQSNPAADMLVMQDLAKVVALAVDQAAINGSGTSGQPLGIVGTAGIGSVTGTSLGNAGIIEFQTDIASANADISAESFSYITTPAVAGLLSQRQRFASTDSPLWSGNLAEGRLGGCRAFTSAQIPAASMLAGDFSQLIVGEWSVLELQINPFANFQAGIVGVRAMYSVDIGVRVPGAFSYATSIT